MVLQGAGENFGLVTLSIIVVSMLPMVSMFLKKQQKA